MAGFVPGVLLGLSLMLAIYFTARVKKLPAMPWAGFREIFASGFSALGGIMLIVIVLGSIYGGICSPTEAAALSAVYAYFVAVFVYRDRASQEHALEKTRGIRRVHDSAQPVDHPGGHSQIHHRPPGAQGAARGDQGERDAPFHHRQRHDLRPRADHRAHPAPHRRTHRGLGPAGLGLFAGGEHPFAHRRKLHGAVGHPAHHGPHPVSHLPAVGDRPIHLGIVMSSTSWRSA
jgi:hypothetical protein